MTLKDRITDDMKAAMRARDSDRLLAIRMLLAALKQKEVDERVVLDDLQVVAIVDKQIKQRKDSIAAFSQAGRTDLVDKESAEMRVLEAYLPQRLVGRRGGGRGGPRRRRAWRRWARRHGRVMAAVKAELAGKADMGLVSAAVNPALAKKVA